MLWHSTMTLGASFLPPMRSCGSFGMSYTRCSTTPTFKKSPSLLRMVGISSSFMLCSCLKVFISRWSLNFTFRSHLPLLGFKFWSACSLFFPFFPNKEYKHSTHYPHHHYLLVIISNHDKHFLSLLFLAVVLECFWKLLVYTVSDD